MRKAVSLVLALSLALTLFFSAGFNNSEAADSTYTVKSGDTLTGIAARFGLTVSALAQTNGIQNVNNIFGGQVLKLPAAAGSNSNNNPPAPTSNEKGYLVQNGDTLSGISSRFGVSIAEIAALNGLSVLSFVYTGQTLKIPGSPAPAPVVTTSAAVPATPLPVAATQEQKPAGGLSYTVQTGDSLSSIAARYGLSLDTLLAANKLANSNLIFSGQVLNIPGGQGGAVSAPQGTAAAQAPAAPVIPAGTGKWIDVNLTQQRLVAYEGNTPVFSSLVSTGVSNHPTVTGTFNIYVKYTSQAMTGGRGAEYYYLPNVPYVMYFYEAYAIHGAYWHNNFGRVMSHGCVNMPIEASKFMYNWAPVGTPVTVHF